MPIIVRKGQLHLCKIKIKKNLVSDREKTRSSPTLAIPSTLRAFSILMIRIIQPKAIFNN